MAKEKRETFKELFAGLQASVITASKPIATIEERVYFLIVCEGENEQNRFTLTIGKDSFPTIY